jgi:8-oxo-dGTP diphosphatase
MRDSVAVVHGLVARIAPHDALESYHRTDTLHWLESTHDVFRRAKPATPPRHLVSYVVVLDRSTFDVLRFPDGADEPVFVTVTTTIGLDAGHTDVSLWFVAPGSRGMRLAADDVEFRGVRWWSQEEITSSPATLFDPHFGRFLEKVQRHSLL